MKLENWGTADKGAVLLLTGERFTPAQVREALPGLEKRYHVLVSSGTGASPEELFDALRCAGVVRLWGAYGLEAGADALLAFLAAGSMEVRTAVTEGCFSLPAASLAEYPGTLICWKGGRDKPAEKSWKALKAQRPGLRSLTLDKLKKGQTYLSRRPDLMEKRLTATFGDVSALQVTDVFLGSEKEVWQFFSGETGSDFPLLRELAPPREDEARHIRIREGRGEDIPFWNRRLELERAGDGAVKCVDQVEYSAGKRQGRIRRLGERYLRSQHRRLAQLLRR